MSILINSFFLAEWRVLLENMSPSKNLFQDIVSEQFRNTNLLRLLHTCDMSSYFLILLFIKEQVEEYDGIWDVVQTVEFSAGFNTNYPEVTHQQFYMQELLTASQFDRNCYSQFLQCLRAEKRDLGMSINFYDNDWFIEPVHYFPSEWEYYIRDVIWPGDDIFDISV